MQDDSPQASACNLRWIDGRWHCDGRGIHAGETLELRAVHTYHYDDDGEEVSDGPGKWLTVRLESEDQGRVLVAHYFVEGLMFRLRLDPGHEVRWKPER